jgi:transcriptional regulator with XRE-family HTH domain
MRKAGKGLRDLVKKRGLTQGQIAVMSKKYRQPAFSRQYINKIMNGYVPPPETLEIIMKILRCKLISINIAVEVDEDGNLGDQYHV